MGITDTARRARRFALLPLMALVALTAGCSGDVLGVLPEAASPEAAEIDHLIYLIIWLTGGTFVLVEGLFVWFLWKHRAKPGKKAGHTHGNHAVELAWTVVPALILVLLAVYQAELWLRVKSGRPDDATGATSVRVFAKQFEWNFRYPGPDGEFDLPGDAAPDDLVTTGSLVVPIDTPVLAELRSMDVLHSFFLPNLRFKQDAVPGLPTNIWFRSNKLSADRAPVKDRDGVDQQLDYWDIVCAELCGNAHTTMSGRLYVVSRADYDAWIAGTPTSVKLPERGNVGPEGTTASAIWGRWADQDTNEATAEPRWKRNPFGEDDKGADAVTEDEDF